MPCSAGPSTRRPAPAARRPHWRLVLWLVDVERYSPSELGSRLSMTPNAVSSLAARARKALRDAYAATPTADA